MSKIPTCEDCGIFQKGDYAFYDYGTYWLCEKCEMAEKEKGEE